MADFRAGAVRTTSRHALTQGAVQPGQDSVQRNVDLQWQLVKSGGRRAIHRRPATPEEGPHNGRDRNPETDHRRATAGARRRVRAREEGAGDHRDLRPGARRPAVPGGGVGGREQADVHAAGRHGHRGERSRRPGEPDGQADEDPRRAARRAAPEERRHHRGDSREGNREIRQAGGNHRLHRPHDQSGPHARGQRDLRDQGARRRDLLAASALEEDVVRDGAADARGAGARGRARRHPAVPDPGQHPDVAGGDGAGRPGRRDRRPADGPRGVQLRHARLRRRRRQLDDDHRRDGQYRGGGAQHAAVEDVRLRLGLLRRRQPHHRGEHLRPLARPAAGRRRLPRVGRGEGRAAQGDVGRRGSSHRPTPSRSPRSSSRGSPASRSRPIASSSSSTATASARSTRTPARS